MKGFQGIFPALLTPMHADESINHAALRSLVRFNLDKGVSGFYSGGSTAEAFLLSLDERKAVLDTVIDENAGEGTIIAHVGCISQEQAVELAQHAQKAGADAISSIPPFYYAFSFDEIRHYYVALADAVDIPVIIYNFPAYSGVKLTTENIRTFLDDPRFIGVKHTSSDYMMLERIKQIRPEAIVYNGYDEMFLSGLAAGADGGIGSTYNFMADKFIAIREAFNRGDMNCAQSLQQEANNIISVLINIGVLQGEKEALSMMGIEMGNCRKPFSRVSEEGRAMLRKVLIENGYILS